MDANEMKIRVIDAETLAPVTDWYTDPYKLFAYILYRPERDFLIQNDKGEHRNPYEPYFGWCTFVSTQGED